MSSFGRTVMGEAIRESFLKNGCEKKFQIANGFSYTVRRDYSHLCMRMTSNWLERNKINPFWKVINKEFDLGRPTSFLDHVYLGCSQRECEKKKKML